MTASDDSVLDEAFGRFLDRGPEFRTGDSNHGPMASEAMTARGFATSVGRWIDTYAPQLDEAPAPHLRINPDHWAGGIGDALRTGDWIAYFSHSVEDEDWREVLALWWPRLLPGIAAGSTHAVIRTGHAVRALRSHDTPARRAELARGLAYWAAGWRTAPGSGPRTGTATPAAALDLVPRLDGGPGSMRTYFARLAEDPRWWTAAGSLRTATEPQDAARLLDELVHSAVGFYAANGRGIMLVHAATAPNAIARVLPVLPERLWAPSVNAAWTASAAVVANYAPAVPRPLSPDPVPHGPEAATEVFARAVEHGDEHVIKLADTAWDVHQATGDPSALAAVMTALAAVPGNR
ncbi:questin oxidase family protein [Streptomyces parvus]|uniref:questin oxidase family protein n=1 Tax=Streptomyces parvus TaxID=66428 RepID=UPI003450A82D